MHVQQTDSSKLIQGCLQNEVKSEHIWEFRDELIKLLTAPVIYRGYSELDRLGTVTTTLFLFDFSSSNLSSFNFFFSFSLEIVYF